MATASRSGRGRWMCSDPDDAHLHYRLPHHRTRSRRALCALSVCKNEKVARCSQLCLYLLYALYPHALENERAVKPSLSRSPPAPRPPVPRATGTRGRGTVPAAGRVYGLSRHHGRCTVLSLTLFISFFAMVRLSVPYSQLAAVLRAHMRYICDVAFLPIVR